VTTPTHAQGLRGPQGASKRLAELLAGDDFASGHLLEEHQDLLKAALGDALAHLPDAAFTA